MDMDSNTGNQWPNPKRLKTLASNVGYAEGNNLLHQFVLDNSPPHQSRSESYLNAHLLAISCSSLDVNALNEEGYSPLHLAVLKNNSLMVKKLLSCLANIDVNTRCNRHKDKNTALHLAANLGHLDIVEALLDKEASIDIANSYDETALCLAVQSGHFGIMKLLVRKGANVNLMGSYTFPLHYAAGSSNFESVIFLVSNGADIDAVDRNGWTPLCHAARYGHLGTIKFLLDRDANLNFKSKSGRELFLCAIKSGDLETIEFFMDKCADLNTGYEDGCTPLHKAIESGNLAVVEFLVRKGANVNAKDFCNNTPHHYAALKSLEIIQFLLNKSGEYDINAKGRNGTTLLHNAVISGKLEIVKYLLDNGADWNAMSEDGKTVLHYAVIKGCLGSVALLLDKGADVNAKDKEGRAALHKAINDTSSIEVTKMLIERGANVNATDVNGKTPLHLVCYYVYCNNNFEDKILLRKIKLLLEGNADVYIRDKWGLYPLYLAMRSNSCELYKLFLESASKLKTFDCNAKIDGQSMLHYAVSMGHLESVTLLIDKGADVNGKDDYGDTPLHTAVILESSIEVTKMLIEKGADVNATDVDGKAPLHHLLGYFEYCIQYYDYYVDKIRMHLRQIKLLLDGNADVNIKDKNEETPLCIAMRTKSCELVELFSESATELKTIKD